MANKPLKTITYPGLSDTYTVPQIDNTLSVTGRAADAKATGDAVGNFAPVYSSSKTYSVGDFCTHNNKLYKCSTAISTAEAWTAGHWTQATVGEDIGEDISELKSDLQQAIDDFAVPTQEAVDNWLDEHPEATTTVQDGSITESKFSDALKLKTIKDYVIPEMFGAAGDGVTDDTDAVQEAFDSGKNVCFLLTSQYLITDTIRIKKISREGFTAFSEAVTRWAPFCRIIVSFDDSTHPVFSVEDDGWTFENLSINAKNGTAVNLTLFNCRTNAADVDFSLINCAIYGAKILCDIEGRGFSMQNCFCASLSQLLNISWSGEGSTPYHDDETGQRAFTIEGNRFHSCGREATAFIIVNSGNVFGLRFVNNNFDRGYTSLVKASTKVKNWLISGNTFHGMGGNGGNDAFILLSAGADEFTFTSNVFANEIESNSLFHFVIEVHSGNSTAFLISNNDFNVIRNGNVLSLTSSSTTLNGLIMCNNYVENVLALTTQKGLFLMVAGASCAFATFANNVIRKYEPDEGTSNRYWIIRATSGFHLENAKIIGNVVYTDVGRQVSFSGTDYTSNVVYDWNFATQS